MALGVESGPPKIPLVRDPRFRGLATQLVLFGVLALVAYLLVRAAANNLARANVATGFGFWTQPAGFDISQTLIDYSSATSTYGRAFWVGLLNTLLVAALGIVLATILGFIIGIARLSSNWLVERCATGYVELVRNVPLLLQLLFWYNAVLKALPDFRESIRLPGGVFLNNRGLFLPGGVFLNNRGLFLPAPDFAGAGETVSVAFALGLVGALILAALAPHRRIIAVGAAALVFGFPIGAFLVSGAHVTFEYPQVSRFNVHGGIEILPELAALVMGLVIYTAAFIADVVRAGLQAVPRGQVEAAYALGLRRLHALRFIIVPQAMRVIIPPLTNQYLNLTKNSSLAVAIGYPDLVQIFTGTVLNQTGQAVEIVAITMAVYLSISLGTSFLMNVYNARMALVER